MKTQTHIVTSLFLLACVSNAFGQDAAPPKLPDQYVEVVLDVEGMI